MARLFLARVAFFFFPVVAVSFSWGDIKTVAARKPNVLMIIVDDMNDFVGCMGGNPDTHTPNIDKLASRGILF
ncbi:MAG: iduronate-2-sulfatase, partial [Planctomycetota bacterium]|nr:iduronate-2-sulfatase [Planctomycetota bacterium]